jgi:hypothetical protein
MEIKSYLYKVTEKASLPVHNPGACWSSIEIEIKYFLLQFLYFLYIFYVPKNCRRRQLKRVPELSPPVYHASCSRQQLDEMLSSCPDNISNPIGL